MENNLPKNWVETEVGEILKLKNGFAFKSKDYREEGVPLIRISNIQQGEVSTEKSIYVDVNESAEDFIIERGDVLVAMSGATTGKYGVFNEEIKVYQNQRVGNLKPLIPDLTSKQFIYYLLGGLKKEIEEKAYGGAQPNISAKLIETIKISLPPLAEQQRIVAKLDELFGHLDSLKKRLENIPTLLKNLKQAILTLAVTGKLTQEWRVGKELESIEEFLKQIKQLREDKIEKKDDKIIVYEDLKTYSIPKEWKWVRLWELSYLVTSGSRGWSKYYSDEGAYFVRSAEINNNKLRLEEAIKVNLPDKIEGKRSLIEKGNILTTVTGANVGKCAKIEKDIPESYVSQSVALTKIVDNRLTNYIHLTLLSPKAGGGMLKNQAYGLGRPVLSLPQIKSLFIPLPPMKEQTEIVKRVEHLFAKADKIEAQYKSLKTKIDNLPQAILAKAFKGELVAQLDTDGDAKELLAEIQALKESLAKKPKKKVVRKKKKPNA